MRARVGCFGILLVAALGCSGVDDGAADDAVGDGDDLAATEETAEATDEGTADELSDDDAAADEDAASGDDGPEVALPDGAPIPVGAVPPGVYRSGVFRVPASFEVFEDGWYAEREGPFAITLLGEEVEPEPELSLVTTQLPTSVDELVAELEALADDDFTVTRTGPTSLGGLDGTVLEATLTRTMMFEPLNSSTGAWFTDAEDALLSIHVLETGANPVLVWFSAERAVYQDLIEQVQPILESLLFAP
jgi:hypothetical protein